MKFIAPFILMATLLISWSILGWKRVEQITLGVEGGIVNTLVFGYDWQTICIIGPYSDKETAKKITGIEIDIERYSHISSNDNIALIIKLSEDKPPDYDLFDVKRRPSDFTSISNSCWPKNTTFHVSAERHPLIFVE